MSIVAPPTGLESLLSPLTGVVSSLGERLLEPGDALLHSCWSDLAVDVAGGAAAEAAGVRAGGGWSPSARVARAAAIGEAVERGAATRLPAHGVLAATFLELGGAALDPARLSFFLPGQIAGTPYRQADPGLRLRWVRGERLPSREPVWVPAQLVYLADLTGDGSEPPLTVPTSNGLACGGTREGAILSALLELVERDAFTLTWAGRHALPLLTWEGVPALEDMERHHLARTGLDHAAVDLSAFLGVPVALAVVRRPDGEGPAAVGAAAARTAREAVPRALAEAYAAFAAARALSRLRPNRVFASDGSDLESFDDRVQYYAEPERAAALAFLTASPERRHVDDVAPLPGDAPEALLEALCDRLAAHGAEAAAVDITPPDVGAAGLHVVRAVCPELCPIDAYHALRFLGVPRLLTGAWQAGLRSAPLRLEEVNPDPHPFP